MLVGAMPAATSQLIVDKTFVLRHLDRGYGPEVLTRRSHHPRRYDSRLVIDRTHMATLTAQVMQKTLLADQLRRHTEAMKKELVELNSPEGMVCRELAHCSRLHSPRSFHGSKGQIGKMSDTERKEVIAAAKRAGDLEAKLVRSCVSLLIWWSILSEFVNLDSLPLVSFVSGGPQRTGWTGNRPQPEAAESSRFRAAQSSREVRRSSRRGEL